MQMSNVGSEICSCQFGVGQGFARLVQIIQQTQEFISETFSWFQEPDWLVYYTYQSLTPVESGGRGQTAGVTH